MQQYLRAAVLRGSGASTTACARSSASATPRGFSPQSNRASPEVARCLDADLAESLVLIVDEAVTNAVEHACPDTECHVTECHVTVVAGLARARGGIAVLVPDTDLWQDVRDPGYGGHGTALMSELSDRSSIETTERGNAVRLCWATPPSTAP
ncbi:ATP-binding protein [Actinomycetospora flava]|uniref:ATP-binding protein n=1 Tax=Actinomycetospora flava TaxID=3129232 RepID=A0ABU8MDE5_9PSEU